MATNSSSRERVTVSDVDLRIFIRDVNDPHSRKRPLIVKTWSSIKDVKDHVQKLLHVPPSAQRLYYSPLMIANSDLPNHRTLHDAGIDRNGETLYLEIKATHDHAANVHEHDSSSSISKLTKANDICVSKSFLASTNKALRRILQQARRGMTMGLKPILVLDGSGGTYFLHDARKIKVAVFKPADEEPYAENNPRGHVRIQDSNEADSISMRDGIKPGEACLREVAAYLLDHDNFSGVPMTTLAEARHPAFHSNGSMLKVNQGGAAVGSHSLQLGSSPLHNPKPDKKVGSFQEFVSGECCMDDLSPSKISTEEVHKIAILDIRILNADRNTANLICKLHPEDEEYELVPIDHGYCLRTAADVCWFDWCWLDWPQLKEPVSARTKKYILDLDIEADVLMLKERLNLPERALDYFRASSKLLQAGIKNGMTLYDVAVLCCRNDGAGELPSRLETLMKMADDISKSAIQNGRWHHSAASRALEQQLSPNFGNLRMRKSTGTCNSLNLFKSKSSLDFSSYLSDNSPNPPTPMAQSSGSESSAENDGIASVEEEEEECDVWAAAMIANTLEPTQTVKPSASRRQRAISFAHGAEDDEEDDEDDDCDLNDSVHSMSSCSSNASSNPSSSFWFVRPTDSKDEIVGETTWSPHESPSIRSDSPQSSLKSQLDMEGLELDKKVKFDMRGLIPPMNMRQTTETTTESSNYSTDGKTFSTSFHRPKRLTRCNSYSAFSSFRSIATDDNDDSIVKPGINSRREHAQKLRQYSQKFIDLLIDREITPIIRSRQASLDIASTNNNKNNNKNAGSGGPVDMNRVCQELERAI